MDLSAIFAALGVLVLERGPGGAFIPSGPMPGWYTRLRTAGASAGTPFTLEEVFPFLAAFHPLAEQAWREGAPPIDSEFWTEVGLDGADIHLEASAIRIEGHDLLIVSRNDRAFREAQLLLQRARELRMVHRALVKEIEEKEILVHTIVHDLGAPLHSILGTLTLLSEHPLPDPCPQWIDIALRAAARQRRWIDQILDVFAAERGAPRGTGGLGPVDLTEVVEQVKAELEPRLTSRRVRLEARGPRTEFWVAGEETRLFRVVMNLTDNALRSSPPEALVAITLIREGGLVRLTMDDEGPGVPPELVPRLFGELARGRGSAGTGLGLYFCRITLERWGGRIGYAPRPGGGARFWATLPAAEPPRSHLRATKSSVGSEGRG